MLLIKYNNILVLNSNMTMAKIVFIHPYIHIQCNNKIILKFYFFLTTKEIKTGYWNIRRMLLHPQISKSRIKNRAAFYVESLFQNTFIF